MDKVNHILFVSVSEESDSEGLKQAISLAKSNLAKLSVIVCIDDLRKLNHQNNLILIQDMLDQKRDELKTYIKGFTDDEIKINVTLGKPFIEIIREVIENNIDLVIKPIDPIGFKSIVFGSQDLKLLRLCPCPLWLIKSTEQIGEKQIVVAIDYEPDNHENELLNIQLLKIGVSLALSQFAELHIVHAWKLEHENFYRSHRINYTHEEVDKMVEEKQSERSKWLKETVNASLLNHGKETSSYLSPVLHLKKGSASKIIPNQIKNIKPELLIMGTVARTGIPGFFIGNTAETILFDVDCSVLALKPEAFVSPVKLEQKVK